MMHSKRHVFFDILLVAAPILLLGATGSILGLETAVGATLVNLGYGVAIIIGGVLLQRQNSSWCVIGLARPAVLWKTLLAGLGAACGALVIYVLTQIIVIGILMVLGLTPSEIDQSRFNPVEGNLSLYLLMILLAWTTIAFGEELFYRAFLISRLVDQATFSKPLAIAISSILFGIVHFAEGPLGILSNSCFGAFFGWIYLRSHRNLWITLIGHGLINTFRFTLLYVGAL